MRQILLLLLLQLLLLPSIASAWGETAHQVVCEIALAELTPAAEAEVDRLIGLDPEYSSFGASCLFASSPTRKRAAEHYVNVPRDTPAIVTDDCPLAPECLFTAIAADLSILSNPGNADADRLRALKFLGHWVGDMHTPMHISFADDRGGNDIIDRGDVCNEDLHGAWDTCIPEVLLGTDVGAAAARLGAEITEQDRLAWRSESPIEWANESFRIATDPTVDYCTQRDDACWYSPHDPSLNDGEEKRSVATGQDYVGAHGATVELRIKQAGVRLGALLNRLLQ